MRLTHAVVATIVVMFFLEPVLAQRPPGIFRRKTLTDDWFGLGGRLAEKGVLLDMGLTQVWQANLRGGIGTHRRSGRYAGSYDLELELDTEKLFGVPGGGFFCLAEGSWSEGVDASPAGGVFGLNDDAAGDRSVDVSELWYEQGFGDGRLRFRLGKLDLTGGFECRGCPVAFDASAYANDETAQFLNSALVNNPTIPFPENGLGLAGYFQLRQRWYAAAGLADARADARETGFNTAFHGRSDFFGICETGVVPHFQSRKGRLPGAYRVGLWYDPRPKHHLDGQGIKRDDAGFYVSCDQMVFKENTGEQDSQGLGLFARYGSADAQVNEIESFWSVGAQFKGMIPARDDDVLGFGAAQGRLNRAAGFTAGGETAMELYYNCRVTPWMSLAPSVQYVFNPAGRRDAQDAVVIGARLQMSF